MVAHCGKTPMMPQLVSLGEGATISIDRPILIIGRHPDCDVQIYSRKISRRHCCVMQLEGRLVVRDLGSTNGIYCNGQRVGEVALMPNDELQIANLSYQYVTGAETPKSTDAPKSADIVRSSTSVSDSSAISSPPS